LSGRYAYNGGINSRANSKFRGKDSDQPVAVPYEGDGLCFTLHVDIDGGNPLNIVSGDVANLGSIGDQPTHFIGRVKTNEAMPSGQSIAVEDFSFIWPGSDSEINRLELRLSSAAETGTSAEVLFQDTVRNLKYGPFIAVQESIWFREVEIDIDRESSAVAIEPYNTYLHPDRPPKVAGESLMIEGVFAKAGIRITRSEGSDDVIDTTAAGEDSEWSYSELHDSMQLHWDAFANKPQWKMWLFFSGKSERSRLGGVMFDADIDESGGVDRQGVAIFTRCEYFFSPTGGFVEMNPPCDPAAARELFFTTVHEIGHAFNLAHPFERTAGRRWQCPPWQRARSNRRMRTWMNYPNQASPVASGANATWFYKRFTFQFDKHELLFLRHAPAGFVQMGSEPWFQNHARVAEKSIDRRLRLAIQSRKHIYELGEPILIELRLRNVSDQPIPVYHSLDPSDGLVELAVTNPDGIRRPYLSIDRTRVYVEQVVLEPHGASLYESVDLTLGTLGFPFKKPGTYRIEATYMNMDGSITAGSMQLQVRPPADSETLRTVSELFDVRLGLVLYVDGTRLLEDVNEKLDWVRHRLGPYNPISMHLTTVRFKSLAKPAKVVSPTTSDLQVIEPEPDRVVHQLTDVVIEQPDVAADTMGHIYFRDVVDTFTKAAIHSGAAGLAKKAQEQMLNLFKSRNVLPSVITSVEERVSDLRAGSKEN
jgi:hypothetical protein